MANISQIKVGETTYNIDAVTVGGKTYQEIINLVNTAQLVVCSTADNTPKGVSFQSGTTKITGTLEASAADTNNIYLVPSVNATGDSYDEYVAVGGTSWEKIGNTDIDLSGYAKKGTYSTSAAIDGESGAGGATTVVSKAGEGSHTATGSATISYQKSATVTGSNSGSTTSTTEAAQPTITASFSGTEATLAHKVNDTGHVHTLTKTTASVNSVGSSTGSSGSHTHSINSHTHAANLTVVTGITFSGGSAASLSKSTTAVLNKVTGTSGTIASVSGTILTLASSALTGVSGETTNVVNGITFTPNTVATLTNTTATASGSSSAATLTTGSAGAHTHSISSTSITVMTDGSIENSKTGITVRNHTYTPEGNVSASQDAHTHSYNAPAAHTHSIALTTTSVTGTASVAVGNHTHSVVIPDHTHTIAHTHNVTIS